VRGADDTRERAGDQAADRRQAEEGRGVDAHHASAHVVCGQMLQQRIDRCHGDDHAVAGDHEQQSGEIEVAREGEGDDGGVESGGRAHDKKPAAAHMGEPRDGDGAQESSGAGAGHQNAEAGLAAAEDVTGEVRNEGEVGDGEQAADGHQQHQ